MIFHYKRHKTLIIRVSWPNTGDPKTKNVHKQTNRTLFILIISKRIRGIINVHFPQKITQHGNKIDASFIEHNRQLYQTDTDKIIEYQYREMRR